MAFNFDSGQFNQETVPKRIGNWQVPRWSPSRARPPEMRPDPKPICDINGHFLPGAPKGSSKCFGHFTGTWELPKKINRKVAEELAKEPPGNRFADWVHPRVQRPKVASTSIRMRPGKRGKATEETEKARSPEPFQDQDNEINANGNINREFHDVVSERREDDPLELQGDSNQLVDSDGHNPYVPGSLTDPKHRHESYDLLLKDSLEKIHGPKEDQTDHFWRKVAENAKYDEQIGVTMKYEKKSGTPKLPYVNVSQNFQFAKKMHVGNLEHQPLPDTLGYRHLTKVGEHRDSDIVVKPYAIGWKGFGASGPTCCTKMRVHRPKTCDPKKSENEVEERKQRPSTSALDLGGQYKKPMSLMDLAICWDFRPDDAKLEPSPPKHIDGSNGSKAPAVFTMVHTPKEEIQNAVSHSVPIFNKNRIVEDMGHHPVPYFEKDMTKEKRKDSCDVQYCPQHNTSDNVKSRSSSRKSSTTSARNENICDGVHGCGTPSSVSRSSNGKRPSKFQAVKDAWNKTEKNNNFDAHQKRNSLESYEKTPLAQGKLHQSSPNESISKHSKDSLNNVKHKHCFSCNGVKMMQEPKQKEDYKFAFKAGNPNSVQSVSSSDSKNIKMPKMRHPYTKKSYTIPTLAPPFSIWRDANATGYPEHWRLASVYQHAYKPPDQRRKPLLNSVYQ